MRLTCRTRSAVRVSRSRLIRRRSSSWGVGAWTIAQTRGSPRLSASRARTRASPSILSVFARRRRRDVAIEAGSTTWLSIPSFCRTRWIQNPSSPASWMTMTGKMCPVRARAFSVSWDKRARRAAMSPLRTACFDIFSPPPGASDVMTQVERLSSRDKDRVEIGADSGVFVRSRTEGLHGRSRVSGSAPSLCQRARCYQSRPWDLFEGADEPLRHTVGLGLADEGKARRQAEEGDLVLEGVGHKGAAVVVAEQKAAPQAVWMARSRAWAAAKRS